MDPEANLGNLHQSPSRPTNGSSRRRAVVACRQCSLRKVRCDVATSGIPCRNCVRDEVVCKVMPRKKRRPRQATAIQNLSPETGSCDDSRAFQGYEQDESTVEIGCHLGQPIPTASPTAHHYSSSPNTLGPHARVESSDGGEEANAFVQALDPTHQSPRDEATGLFYFGGRQGLGGFMFDICQGPTTQRTTHYVLPLPKVPKLLSEEEAYLRSLGALTLPEKEICDSLIQGYFRNVHQLLPIIDVQEFLTDYVHNGTKGISLLLLWSIFFASSNFADSEVLGRAGFSSRKDMKRALYRRAKALYDCDYEKEKITLIQSVILIGLWYNDTNDRNGAWHWSGVAISLSQSIGLHRQLRLAAPFQSVPQQREKLYRRIWWTCLVRDRWLSLAKGQPMKIHATECDVAEPSLCDITGEIADIDPGIRSKYVPWDPDASAGLWLRLVHISKALGSVLEHHDKVTGPPMGVRDIRNCEEEINRCSRDRSELDYEDPTMSLFASQIQLLYEAAIVVLFRPYISKGPSHPDTAVTKQWQQKSLDKARSAAANTSRILESLLEADSVKYLKSMTITALVPAMQIHLLDGRSSNAMVRRFAAQKLQICMIALSELRRTYWGADFVLEMFQRAQKKISEVAGDASQNNVVPRSIPTRQAERFVEVAQQLPLVNSLGATCSGCHASSGMASDNALNPYEMNDTDFSAYGTDLDDSFQFLLNSHDFSSLFLDMV